MPEKHRLAPQIAERGPYKCRFCDWGGVQVLFTGEKRVRRVSYARSGLATMWATMAAQSYAAFSSKVL